MTDHELKEKAIQYWQNRLAKFFPTSPGPTTVEIDMFKAGYEYALSLDRSENDWDCGTT